MIPASYLFKDTYRRQWEEPYAPSVVESRRSFFSGLMTPIAGALDTVFARRTRTRHACEGGHAYE